ncbi:MAG: flagellar basal body P-ring formation protein FlgA [Deltaproteobacteria bacterium]|nr:flagellar basal body P-ring formation protein FlgA [Deltaproteobacteria bacterium]
MELRIGDRTLRFQIVLVVEQIYSVVRLARAARKGDIIASADVVVEQARSVDALERPIGDLALCLGKRLRSDAAAGSTLLPRDLEAIPIVHPKDPVRVTMKSGALFASAPGEAQQAGARGDTIRVINLLSSKIVLARVLDATSVEMLP